MALPDYREASVIDLIASYQVQLNLLEWDIRYDPEWISRNDLESATINMEPFAKKATLRISEDVPDRMLGPHIVHELFHIVMKDYTQPVNHMLSKINGGLGLMDHLLDMEERICETVAFALTGTPWEPVGKKSSKWHRPFVAVEDASDNMRSTKGAA